MSDSPRKLPPAIEVVTFLCELGQNEDEPEEIDPFRAQKLLYLVQGYSLARLGRPIFQEAIEAWDKGPVVDAVYQILKKFGGTSLPQPARKCRLTDEEKALIASVWEDYKQYSNLGLYTLTHGPGPWSDARGDLPKGSRSNREITRDSLASFFQKKMPEPFTTDDLNYLVTVT